MSTTRIFGPGILAMLCLTATLAGCARSGGTAVVHRERPDLEPVAGTIDSIALPFLFYPERWFLTGGDLYVLNSRAEPFLTVYSLSERKVRTRWGGIGRGPHEFPIPSLGEMRDSDRVAIYSNRLNRMETFALQADSLVYRSTLRFPVWVKNGHNLPKPYTRLIQYDDSLFVGTSFLPREIVVELLDMRNERTVDAVDFPLRPAADGASGPFACKVALEGDRMAAAYRYVDRIELYDLSPAGFRLTHVLGSDQTQEALYAADRDDEMRFYYADVVCGGGRVYALRQDVPEGDLGTAASRIELIDLRSGETLRVISTGRYLSDILVDEATGIVYGHDPHNEEYLFFCRIPE